MKTIGYFIIIFVSAARSSHTRHIPANQPDKQPTHLRLLKQTKKFRTICSVPFGFVVFFGFILFWI